MSLALLLLSSCTPETDSEKIVRYQKTPYEDIIQEIHTPQEARWYIQHYIVAKEDASHALSFRVLHTEREGDCSEAIIAAAALLSDDGYPAEFLLFRDSITKPEEKSGHAVFVYRDHGLWGSLGINRSDVHEASFPTLEDLAKTFPYKEYAFAEMPSSIPDWISTSENLNIRERFLGLWPEYHAIVE